MRNGRINPAYKRRMVIVIGLSLLPISIAAGEILFRLLQ